MVLKILVIVGLGALMLMISSLLLGCGSDSNSGKSVQAKKEKTTAGSKNMGQQPVITMLTDKEGILPREMRRGKPETPQRIEVAPGITREELQAKIAEDLARHDRRTMEVLPGVTREELQAKIAEELARHDRRTMEELPGVTREEIQAKISQQHVPERREKVPPPMGK